MGREIDQGERADLEKEAEGIARTKQQAKAAPKRALGTSLVKKCQLKLKQATQARKNQQQKNKGQDKQRPDQVPTEACTESPWHNQRVRVVAECLHEGRGGLVSDVRHYVGSEPARYRLQVADEHAKGFCQILVESTEVVLESKERERPKPLKIVWRDC